MSRIWRFVAPNARSGDRLEQAERAELVRHLKWNPCIPLLVSGPIGRGITGFQISTSMERTMGKRLDGHDLGIEHQRTSRFRGNVDRSLDAQDVLSCANSSRDDPIDRSAGDDLVGAARRIARKMTKLGRMPVRSGLFQSPTLQARQMGKRLHPDRQFEQVDRHDGCKYARMEPITPVYPRRFGEFRTLGACR